MRGIAEYGFPAFDAAAAFLTRFKGHEVFSPAARDRANGFDPTGLTGHEDLGVLGFDLRAALGADTAWITAHGEAIALLPGWEASAGARAELALAAALGLLAGTMHDFGTDALRPAGEVLAELFTAPAPATTAPLTAEAEPDQGDDVEPEPPDVRDEAADVADEPVPAGEPVQPVVLVAVPTAAPQAAPAYATATSGEVRVTSSTGGQKGTKLARHDLIPTGPLHELAEHYGRGAAKYARVNGLDNWRNGYDWSLSYAAMQRHAISFWGGQDLDPETGSKELVAVVWHCFALIEFMNTPAFAAEFDDRQDAIDVVAAAAARAAA